MPTPTTHLNYIWLARSPARFGEAGFGGRKGARVRRGARCSGRLREGHTSMVKGVFEMDDQRTKDQRLADTLADVMWATIWAAIATYILTIISFALYWITRSAAPGWASGLMDLDPHSVAVIWMATVVLLKVTAFSFAVTAFAVWIWKRRLLRRIGP